MSDAKPENWSWTCEDAKWLCKDLYEDEIDPNRDCTQVIQKHCPSYLYYTKAISNKNRKKNIEAFIAIKKIGDEALLQLVEDGKLPNSYKKGKSHAAFLLYVQIRCNVTFLF